MDKNFSVVVHYRKKVFLATIVIFLLFVSIYHLQNKMWEFQSKYIQSLKETLKVEEELTNCEVRKIELESLIEILNQNITAIENDDYVQVRVQDLGDNNYYYKEKRDNG